MSEAENTAQLLEAELQAQRQKLKEQKAAEKRQKKARNQTERAKRKTDRSKARTAARAAAPGRMVIVLNGRPVEARIIERPDTIVGSYAVAPVRTGAVQARPQVRRPAPGSVNMPRGAGPAPSKNAAPARKPSHNKAPAKKKTSSNVKKASTNAKAGSKAPARKPTSKNIQGKKSNNSAPSKKPAAKR